MSWKSVAYLQFVLASLMLRAWIQEVNCESLSRRSQPGKLFMPNEEGLSVCAEIGLSEGQISWCRNEMLQEAGC